MQEVVYGLIVRNTFHAIGSFLPPKLPSLVNVCTDLKRVNFARSSVKSHTLL